MKEVWLKHSMKDQWDRISAEDAFFGVLSRGGNAVCTQGIFRFPES